MKRAYPDFWEKVQNDPALKKGMRKKFVRHLSRYKRGDLKRYVEAFFRANKLKGPAIALESDEVLGCVRAKRNFITRLAACAGVSKRKMQRTLDHWVSMDPALIQEEIEGVVGEAPIHSFMMWSYRNDMDTFDPFNGIIVHDLPCRLGLSSFGLEHYAFGHMLPVNKKARQPTAFDGGLCPQWMPGGLTRPHDPCKAKYGKGLPEVVHRPTTFNKICTKLMEITR